MNREPEPCCKCARFIPAQAGTGYCDGYERQAKADDIPWACVLGLPVGSKAHRRATRSEQEVLAELQRRHPETISRASAPTAAPQPERAT